MTKWIKVPDPGQFRGEGTWVSEDEFRADNPTDDATFDEWFEELKATSYLPTAEQEERPTK